MDSPADHVIINAAVIPVLANGRVISPGFVATRGDRIAAVGEMHEAEPWLRNSPLITDASWAAVMPGLVNVHTHLAAGIFRGLLDEGTGGRGLYDIAFPMEANLEPEDIYWLGLLGCIEVLKAGCTTANDIYYHALRLADAVDQVGLRAVLAEKIFDADLARIGQGDYTRDRSRGTEKLAANVKLVEERHGSAEGRILCRIGTHATDTCSTDLLRNARQEARQLGVGLHIHVAQSPIEMAHIRETHNRTPVEYLGDLGFLGPSTLAVHCSNNTDGDLDLMAESDTAYACCPTMYPRRGRFPRLLEFRKRGIRIGLGTDWIRMDPWEGMRNTMSAVRLLHQDPELFPAAELLDLQTLGSARALGMEHEIGSLEVGKRADLVLIDLRAPHLQPYYETLPGIFYSAYPSDVHTVIVGGQLVVKDRRVVTVDEATVLAEVQRRIPTYRAWHRATTA